MKATCLLLLIFILGGCQTTTSVQILPIACDDAGLSTGQGTPITGNNGVTPMCLIVSSGKEVVTWRWAEDGSVFAYALRDPTTTLPAIGGKAGYYQPLATQWYFVDGNGHNVRRFPIADNKGVRRFSPDGKYVIIPEGCIDTVCENSVYKIETNARVCGYTTREVWFSDADCPALILHDGAIWDLRAETNASGCAYYSDNGWSHPNCP